MANGKNTTGERLARIETKIDGLVEKFGALATEQGEQRDLIEQVQLKEALCPVRDINLPRRIGDLEREHAEVRGAVKLAKYVAAPGGLAGVIALLQQWFHVVK